MRTESTDVLIVGSGPIGATFARVLSERLPRVRLTMVEVGPRLSMPPGVNVKNLPDDERAVAECRSQGPSSAEAGSARMPMQIEGTITARAGTHLVDAEAGKGGMPAAAMSTCVGGMGSHWTCATPRPLSWERIPFIPDAEWEESIGVAERLLRTTTPPVEPGLGEYFRRAASELFEPTLPPDRKVGAVPVAATIVASGRIVWTGVDTILGPLADSVAGGDREQLTLRTETICRELLHDGKRVQGARLEHLPTGAELEMRAEVVIVAADALRTPQLLFASSIRPAALGRHLNEHPLVFSVVALGNRAPRITRRPAWRRVDPIVRALRVPPGDESRPFAIQMTHLEECPLPLPEGAREDGSGFAVIGAGGRRQPEWDSRVVFYEGKKDVYGMPKMSLHYERSEPERREMNTARAEVERAANALGDFVPGGEPRHLPDGSSLHYQGTVRMGSADDGQSVCDSHSRVWGYENLFLGGNGLIPTATTCNPTLTSAAIAIRACDRVAGAL